MEVVAAGYCVEFVNVPFRPFQAVDAVELERPAALEEPVLCTSVADGA